MDSYIKAWAKYWNQLLRERNDNTMRIYKNKMVLMKKSLMMRTIKSFSKNR